MNADDLLALAKEAEQMIDDGKRPSRPSQSRLAVQERRSGMTVGSRTVLYNLTCLACGHGHQIQISARLHPPCPTLTCPNCAEARTKTDARRYKFRYKLFDLKSACAHGTKGFCVYCEYGSEREGREEFTFYSQDAVSWLNRAMGYRLDNWEQGRG